MIVLLEQASEALMVKAAITCPSVKRQLTFVKFATTFRDCRRTARPSTGIRRRSTVKTSNFIPGRLGYNVAQEDCAKIPDNSVVRARIDERTKREAAAALKKIGLTVSDAFRLLLVRVAAEKDPNAETVAAMKAARRGDLVKAGKPDKLLRSLNAGR
jgi:DNA-damage-inducible protein J